MKIRLAGLVAGLLLIPVSGAGADNPVLTAIVGTNDAFSITLLDASGKRVTHLDPGTYTIQVHDRSEIHNFHLTSPGGVDQATDVESKEEATWTVTLVDGTYKYVCDPHANIMKGSFTVGAVTTPPPPTAPTALRGTVGPRRSISLRAPDGTRPTLVGTVPVVIVVNDRTKTDNFHLVGRGVNKKTGVGFRGKVTWRLTLQPGKYVYRSDTHKTLRGSFTVFAPA